MQDTCGSDTILQVTTLLAQLVSVAKESIALLWQPHIQTELLDALIQKRAALFQQLQMAMKQMTVSERKAMTDNQSLKEQYAMLQAFDQEALGLAETHGAQLLAQIDNSRQQREANRLYHYATHSTSQCGLYIDRTDT